ncbi:MAG: hypothetical protein QME66_04165 [Candidatus Eisenbacteria bacterium]|nr:hypothetical protein [Candidatus Eisenbacteria bacterium]
MAQARRDSNYVTTLLAVTNDANLTPTNLVVDPTTSRLLVSSTGTISAVTELTGSGTITALDGAVTLNTGGYGAVGIQVTGTWVATLAFECTIDGTNYQALDVFPTNGATSVQSTTSNGQFHGHVGGIQSIRVRASAFTSGTATISLHSDIAGGPTTKAVAGAVGGGGTSMTDDSGFTVGTTGITPAAGTYRTVRDAVDDNDAGAFAMTEKRAILAALETSNADSVMDDTLDAIKVIQTVPSASTYAYTRFADLGANATANVKSSAGNVFSLWCQNENTADRFIQLHNTATTPAGGATPLYTFLISGGDQIVIGTDFFGPAGANFSTGIAFGVSTVKDSFTAATASEQSTVIMFK